jgi:hypothetical protein
MSKGQHSSDKMESSQRQIDQYLEQIKHKFNIKSQI